MVLTLRDTVEEFSNLKSALELLEPIGVNFPFLILFITYDDGESPVIINLQTRGISSETSHHKIVDKSIEFPPEHYQAGVNILSYFGTYLRKNYPSTDARVRIEQDGIKVRLIIETIDGSKEIVEKAIHDYGMMVYGEVTPESVVHDPLLVAELKFQLRMAHLNIETQKDLLNAKDQEINRFHDLLKQTLSRDTPINISLSSYSSNVNTLSSTNVIKSTIDGLSELVELLNKNGVDSSLIEDVNNELKGIEGSNIETVKNSPALSRLRKFIDSTLDTSTEINSTLDKIIGGVELVKGIGKKYNKIAQWCFLPQIPDDLLS